MRKVDLKLYSEYERIQKEYNKLRKKLIKKTRKFEENNKTGQLPSLVIPERKRKITLRTAMRMSRRELWRRINALRKVVNAGESGFFKQFKKSYFELYRMVIGEDPEAFNGYKYSEQQIAEMENADSGLASLMESYNALFQMPSEIFYLLLRRGDIPAFKMIYAEAIGGVSYYESVLDRLSDVAHGWRRMIKHGEISVEEIGEMSKKTQKEIRNLVRSGQKSEAVKRGIEERKEANSLDNYDYLEG